ncbi:MAG: hypothetical protein DRH08_03165 [Deltaproteobacteria bacterium]|nr:MAG: hypothetical protein DRH08_03165 [Deltaproteobacteria bacterium]
MSKIYPPSYEKLYTRLSRTTGMSKDEVDLFILKIIQILESDLHRSGEVILPYLGKFYLKRMPPRKRSVIDFETKQRFTVDIPAQDKLKFTVNKAFKKLFR